MKSALEKWLSPEDAAEEGDIISESSDDFDDDKPTPKSNFKLDTTKVKQTKVDQFDSLFDTPKSNIGDIDDLPF